MSKHVCFNSEKLSEGSTYIYSFKLLSFLLLSVKFPLASGRQTQTWRMDMWTCHRAGVARGEGRINWEIRTDKYTLPCVKHRQWVPTVQHRELSSVLCDDRAGWDVGLEGGLRRGYICTNSRFTSLHSRNQPSIVTKLTPIKIKYLTFQWYLS